MPRFVILEHNHPVLHWDFMLEGDNALRTWRLASPPEPGKRIAATPLADHRLAYLEYEGPVSGGRGSVARWDWGWYEMCQQDGSSLVLRLDGNKVHGKVRLARDADEWHWLWCGDA